MNKDFDQYLSQLAGQPAAAHQEVRRTWRRVQPRQPRRPKNNGKWAALLAACLLLVMGAAIVPNITTSPSQPFCSDIAYAASDYSEIYQALMSNNSSNGSGEIVNSDSLSTPVTNAADDLENSEQAITEDSIDNNYSQTNNQVDGVDEGDIAKTDGNNIYLLRDNELIISSAKGANSTVLSRTQLTPSAEELSYGESYQYPTELYLSGSYLAVITAKSQPFICGEPSGNAAVMIENIAIDALSAEMITEILIYDISDPSSPQAVASFGQDGSYVSSRLIGDTVYLISQYILYSNIDEDAPDTFIPGIYNGGQRKLLAAHDICLLPHSENSAYTVITSIDLSKQKIADQISVLGGSDTIYMNHDNLYLACGSYRVEESAPYSEDQYSVVEREEYAITELMRFSLADNEIALAATGQISGFLDNQFALDEFNGYLRAVTTINNSHYRVYTDEEHGWENYQWDDSTTTNALWILDEQLEITSSLEDLAPGEQVYSVRFAGDIGYFVTFRQVDPLFAVDLTDPYSPQILSELKLPGFSEYLHPYSSGRLLGLGQDADEQSGITGPLKLTMFDTSDPRDVQEKHTLILDSSYSSALYNHKAILVSEEKDLIAFPADSNQYLVYGYNDSEGFYLRGNFTAGEEGWYDETRGLFVDEWLYICRPDGITVVDIVDLRTVLSLDFSLS